MPEVRRSLAARSITPHASSKAETSCCTIDDADLENIRLDMMYLCGLLNQGSCTDSCSIDLHSFYEMIVSLWYRLLRFRSPDEVLRSPVDDVAVQHLGMVLFLMTVLLDNAQQQIVDYCPVRRCIEHVLKRWSAELDVFSAMWFLLMAQIWTRGRTDQALLVKFLRATVVRMDVKTWHEARTRISGLPWITALHDEVGSSIWKNLDSGR